MHNQGDGGDWYSTELTDTVAIAKILVVHCEHMKKVISTEKTISTDTQISVMERRLGVELDSNHQKTVGEFLQERGYTSAVKFLKG